MFYTKTHGIGGRLRQRIEDFIVEEIPINKKDENGEYTIFWLEKFNWDTQQALRAIAKKLHVSAKRFGIAGTKDKRALTKQRVSLWDPKIELLKTLESLKIKDLKIYGFERGEKLNLGDSGGNKFLITIRDISLSEEGTRKRLNSIFSEVKLGMPNFFGPQRFGEVRVLTHLVGKEILKENFEAAVKIYLCKIFDGEPEDAKEARKFLAENWGEQKSYLEALKIFPRRLRYERAMLDYLHKNPKDFAGALRRLPKRLRKMFLNAVQAEIFNKIAKKNIIEAKEKNRIIKNKNIPLVGFNTVLNEKNRVHKKIIEIMKNEGIGQSDFLMKGMPELRCSGSERNLLLKPKNIKIIKVFDDECNPIKRAVQISFELPAGSYATVFLREITKNGF